MADPLHIFFHPRGIAVVGASDNPTKLSHGVLRNLVTHGYRGPVYPVNPKGGAMLGLRVYQSVAEVDLNPLIVGPPGEGAWAVDARIVLGNTVR